MTRHFGLVLAALIASCSSMAHADRGRVRFNALQPTWGTVGHPMRVEEGRLVMGHTVGASTDPVPAAASPRPLPRVGIPSVASWTGTVDPLRGWRVEARFRNVPDRRQSACHAGLFSVYDGWQRHAVTFGSSSVRMGVEEVSTSVAGGTRTLRLERRAGALRVSLDGRRLMETQMAGHPTLVSAPTAFELALVGGCPGVRVEWHSIRWDTAPRLRGLGPAPERGVHPVLSWMRARLASGLGGGHRAELRAVDLGRTADARSQCFAPAGLEYVAHLVLADAYERRGEAGRVDTIRSTPTTVAGRLLTTLEDWAPLVAPELSPVCDPAPGNPCGPRSHRAPARRTGGPLVPARAATVEALRAGTATPAAAAATLHHVADVVLVDVADGGNAAAHTVGLLASIADRARGACTEHRR